MKIRDMNGPCHVVELEHDDQVQLLVPASLERTCVLLWVGPDGKLIMEGGADVIDEIIGEGMDAKVKIAPGLGRVLDLKNIVSVLSNLRATADKTPPAKLLDVLPTQKQLRELEELTQHLLYLHQWREGHELSEKYRKKN